jgi:hypothetical protein
MSEQAQTDAVLRVPELLDEADRRIIVDTLKQLDGLKRQLHKLLGK